MRKSPIVLRTYCLLVFASAMASAPLIAHAQITSGDTFFDPSRAGTIPTLNSWQVSASFKVYKPRFGVQGSLTFYGLGESALIARSTTVLVGPQIALHTGFGWKFFVHAVFGGEQAKNRVLNTPIDDGKYAYALGGGLEVPIAHRLAVRVQGDRLEAPSVRTPNATRARFSIGGVFRY